MPNNYHIYVRAIVLYFTGKYMHSLDHYSLLSMRAHSKLFNMLHAEKREVHVYITLKYWESRGDETIMQI